jgi:hypothetical protein
MARFLALSFALLVLRPVGARATDISTCGQTIEAHDTGVLVADLDCTSDQYQYGVRMLSHATLELNGHTIMTGPSSYATILAVGRADGTVPKGTGVGPAIGSHKGDATIHGPGVVQTVRPLSPGFPTIPAALVLNKGHASVSSATGVVEFRGGEACILGSTGQDPNIGRLELDHVVVHDCAEGGVVGKTLVASNLEVYDAGGVAISTNKADVHAVSVHDNGGNGLFGGQRVSGDGVDASNNSNSGIGSFHTIALSNVTATGNGFFGVFSTTVMLTDSTVTGNGAGDISSFRKPQLVNTTCGKSSDRLGDPWGVCQND